MSKLSTGLVQNIGFAAASSEEPSLLVIVTDVTEQYKNEEKIKESENRLGLLNENLENMVVQRTEQVRELAKELSLAEQKQRWRLSEILHEDLQQKLFAVKTRFGLLKDICKTGTLVEIAEDIAELEKLTSQALDTTKRLAIEFNPPVLQYEGLDTALK